ncbi:ATP/GTP-binding protein [Bacteroides sp. 519]|uniref:AAA family ATPase n=1 Tax=Bacteroides sp. 519 TaxID=2302937 RepID=UPI0013D24AEF|nr:AAA family ATPase [Bacteroides sp. 519]NDV57712.1 ATP-binding protein [Bacteroides sp. 519]
MIDFISFNNFTNFRDNTFLFSKSINVFIGKNGTGKTHILKNIAATVNANNLLVTGIKDSKDYKSTLIAENIINYFKPDRLGNLVRKEKKNSDAPKAEVSISINKKELTYSFNSTSKNNVSILKDEKWEEMNSMYIPPREMLSLFEGFIGLTEKREISFDETYISLAKSLNVPLLKESFKNPLQQAINVLEKELNFNVIQENGRFYIKDENGTTEAHLVAEGFRKLASVMYLILNGELKENSILFWDEPEANLNPALIKVVAGFILELARCGIQIFIATHDYLLTHLLSLYSEYKEEQKTPDMKFFCLSKQNNTIAIEEGETLSSIQNNPILDEYANYYDLEQSFLNSVQ